MNKNVYEFLEASESEKKLVTDIAIRAVKNCNIKDDKLGLEMDLLLAHHVFNLRLEDFLNADDFNFNHDIYGIQNHIDRRNFCFINHFLPRYAKPDAPQEKIIVNKEEKTAIFNKMASYEFDEKIVDYDDDDGIQVLDEILMFRKGFDMIAVAVSQKNSKMYLEIITGVVVEDFDIEDERFLFSYEDTDSYKNNDTLFDYNLEGLKKTIVEFKKIVSIIDYTDFSEMLKTYESELEV